MKKVPTTMAYFAEKEANGCIFRGFDDGLCGDFLAGRTDTVLRTRGSHRRKQGATSSSLRALYNQKSTSMTH